MISKTKKTFLFAIPIFALMLVGVFAFGFSMNPTPELNSAQSIEYNSMVCKEVTRADGTIEPAECSANQIYDTGKEAIEDYLGEGSGGGDAFDWIELGDAALATGAPSAGKAEAYTAHDADGLSAAAGVVGTTSAVDGNWTVYKQFTSTGQIN